MGNRISEIGYTGNRISEIREDFWHTLLSIRVAANRQQLIKRVRFFPSECSVIFDKSLGKMLNRERLRLCVILDERLGLSSRNF
jgi:hypothetical protein